MICSCCEKDFNPRLRIETRCKKCDAPLTIGYIEELIKEYNKDIIMSHNPLAGFIDWLKEKEAGHYK